MRRDLTEREFKAKLRQYGFGMVEPPLGYVKLASGPTHVSVWNAGPTRRQQLAYLLDCDKRERARVEREARERAEKKPSTKGLESMLAL